MIRNPIRPAAESTPIGEHRDNRSVICKPPRRTRRIDRGHGSLSVCTHMASKTRRTASAVDETGEVTMFATIKSLIPEPQAG